jgi:hypothetical protein
MSRQPAHQLAVEDYANEVLDRFPESEIAAKVFLEWAKHDPNVAQALGICWLDTVEPYVGAVKTRIGAIITSAAAARQPKPIESEEYTRERERFVASFRP